MRILDIVDMQDGFMVQGSDLPVGSNQEGAGEIIDPTNEFFQKLTDSVFDLALFKYDTHFAGEYIHSPESQTFPIHCEYGTNGWQLVVDPDLLPGGLPRMYMSKNTFNMWEDNPVSNNITFKTTDEQEAYKNLYHITDDKACLTPGVSRDDFLKDLGEGDEAVIIGVASDFCVHDAILGYLEKGVKVTVLADLVKGIGTPVPGRAPSGDIYDVVNLPVFKQYLDSGQLVIKDSAEFLREMGISNVPQINSPASTPPAP